MQDCETNDCRKEKRGCKGCYYENKNIDKDREIVKEAVDVLTGKATSVKLDFEGTAQAIENVLSELETYKKIAEKLAGELEIHYDYEYVCIIKGDYAQCREKKENSKTCNQCIIDWARKEVEKDENI
jgi:hypothetical protein